MSALDPFDDPLDETRGISLTAEMSPVEDLAERPAATDWNIAWTTLANIERELEAASTDEEVTRIADGPYFDAQRALCAVPSGDAAQCLRKILVAYGLEVDGEASPILRGVDFEALLAEAGQFAAGVCEPPPASRPADTDASEIAQRWANWRVARAEYEAARAASDDHPVEGRQADALDRVRDEAIDALIGMEAPNEAALAFKLELIEQRYMYVGGCGLYDPTDPVWRAVKAEARRFAYMCEGQVYPEGMAA